MEASFARIAMELNRCENESTQAINALNGIVMKWESIRTAFREYQRNLGSLSNYPGLQSKLEMEQLISCDALIAELNRQLVLYEHSLTQCRGTLAKAKDMFMTKPLDVAWSFPPDDNSITQKYEEACQAINKAAASIEAKKKALYSVNTHENVFEPESVLRFIEEWKKEPNY